MAFYPPGYAEFRKHIVQCIKLKSLSKLESFGKIDALKQQLFTCRFNIYAGSWLP